jgi:hypothetical protein
MFDEKDIPSETRIQYPFVRGKPYIFMGEIPNMPQHCIILDPTSSKKYVGYHTENFVELEENEI